MRVLIVSVELPRPGMPNTMAPLARQIDSLRGLGIDVDILEIDGLPKLKYFQALPALWSRSRGADVVHAHYCFAGWVARCQLGRPVVISFMGDDLLGTPLDDGRLTRLSRPLIRLNREFARSVDAVVVKSEEMARVLAPVKAHVLPNGVDLATFKPRDRAEALEALGWNPDRHHVLFPGDPDNPRKAFPLARAAVERAAEAGPRPIELVPLKSVEPRTVPLYMNACSAMLMTSYIEGSPNVVKEAMACDLPVVSVPVGDAPELLRGVEGYAVCPRDPEALGRALADRLRPGRVAAGREAIQAKGLDLESVARRLTGIYDALLARGRAAAELGSR